MEKTMRIRMIITMLLLMATVVVSAQGLKTTVDEDRKAEIRNTLALDYSMLDYSISRVNPKVMGQRLADILNKFQELDKVVKQGNAITITYDTELAENAKNLKKSKLSFTFVDGASEDVATNDFFSNVCRYIKN